MAAVRAARRLPLSVATTRPPATEEHEVETRDAAPATTGGSLWWARLVRWWQPGRFVVGILLGALALWALNGQRGELVGATSELTHLHDQWLFLAAGSELVSLAAFAGMQVWLLRCGGVRIGLPRMLGVTFGAGAIASSIPAGPAFSSIFAYRQYRRGGADDAVALWTLVATLTCASLGLTVLATAGVLLAERQGASFDLIGVTIAVFFVAVVASAVVWQRRIVVAIVTGAIRISQRLTGRPKRDSRELLHGLLGRLKTVHLDFGDLAGAMGWALANWILDCGCLVCCFLAVGARVPWHGLLLAYGAAQLAANLPITPGGLGVVEGSLAALLVAYGVATGPALATVLLYRIVSFWGLVPIGWGTWFWLEATGQRKNRAHPWTVHVHMPGAQAARALGPERLRRPEPCEGCPEAVPAGRRRRRAA